MNEIFHSEDCGLSLICRCCRAEVCDQRLTRSQRITRRGELWPYPTQNALGIVTLWRQRFQKLLGCWVARLRIGNAERSQAAMSVKEVPEHKRSIG